MVKSKKTFSFGFYRHTNINIYIYIYIGRILKLYQIGSHMTHLIFFFYTEFFFLTLMSYCGHLFKYVYIALSHFLR